jgi:hypothetical protein
MNFAQARLCVNVCLLLQPQSRLAANGCDRGGSLAPQALICSFARVFLSSLHRRANIYNCML